jgi:hypothetical protein
LWNSLRRLIANLVIGAKQKEQEEREKREAANQERAGSAYTSPGPEQLQDNSNLSGLPWGGVSLSYMMQSGQQGKSSDSTTQDDSNSAENNDSNANT